MKKRRKSEQKTIYEIDDKMLTLDFLPQMEFNNDTRVAKRLGPLTAYIVDDGHRRSATGRAEGISIAACRRGMKISGKRTVT